MTSIKGGEQGAVVIELPYGSILASQYVAMFLPEIYKPRDTHFHDQPMQELYFVMFCFVLVAKPYL